MSKLKNLKSKRGWLKKVFKQDALTYVCMYVAMYVG